jgi:hypothetical protein
MGLPVRRKVTGTTRWPFVFLREVSCALLPRGVKYRDTRCISNGTGGPVGAVSHGGGIIAASERANEGTYIEAVTEAMRKGQEP